MFNSIRVRLALWHFSIIFLLLLVFSVALYFTARQNLFSAVDFNLQSKAETLLEHLDVNNGQVDFDPEAELLDTKGLFIALYDSQGTLIAQINPERAFPPLTTEWQARILSERSTFRTIQLDQGEQLRVFVSDDTVEDNLQFVFIQVGTSLDGVRKSLWDLRFWLTTLSLLLLFITNVFTFQLTGRLLSPLKTMVQTTEQINERDLSQRLSVTNPKDEIGQLAAAFNRLFERIQRAFESQKRFVSDASHELRTPLTIIQGKLEVALRRARSVEEYHQTLQSALIQAQRLSQLAKRLLLLARADAGRLLLEQKAVRFDQVCLDVCNQMAGFAEQKRVELHKSCHDALELPGDEDLLRQVVLNLLDNAIKYTPAGGTVDVSLCRVDGQAQLTVRDSGVGMPQDELSRIFERFYRVDKARSTQTPGTGLGLSIVKEIVSAHGGAITAASDPGQGTTVTVRIPLSITSVETSCART